jgi:hypothetical protein
MGPQSGNARRLRDFCIACKRLQKNELAAVQNCPDTPETLSRSLIMGKLNRAFGR